MKFSVFNFQYIQRGVETPRQAPKIVSYVATSSPDRLITCSNFSAKPPSVSSVAKYRRAGFSLMEMLIAIFILSLGLIMVAGVFPVAIKWTADDAQSTVGSVIAQNALTIIQADIQYGESTLGQNPYTTFYTANPPQWGSQPYAFGTYQPYPTAAAKPLYYWTAYLQAAWGLPGSPAQGYGMAPYNLYIFVFAKGDPNNTYITQSPANIYQSTSTSIPQIYSGAFDAVEAGVGAPPDVMPIGSLGVDTNNGVVFRETIGTSGGITTVPTIGNGDTVLYVPPATGQTDSPLIYVYETTVSF